MINSLIRSNLKNFQAYSSARSLYQKGVFMDANENPFCSVVASKYGYNLNRYPDPLSMDLRKALGRFLNISQKNIFVGSGSDEIIDLLIRLFVEANEEIIIIEPTYGMYKIQAEIAGVKVKSLLLKDNFQIDVPKLISEVNVQGNKSKMIFLCSPNNPTGTLINVKDVENICRNFKGIVVLDEAYIEFASGPSMIDRVSSIENLVVMRTFSKVWGLAGIRVGYAIAQQEIIEYLDKIKLPYNLNCISSSLATEALKNYKKMLQFKIKILKEKEKLAANLTKMGFEVFPSESSFLLIRYPGFSNIAKKLAEDYGIIIRDFDSKPLLKDCARICVSTTENNKLLTESLKKIKTKIL